MYKIAVVGDYDSIYGFATLGLDTFPVADRKEAEEKIEALASQEYGIIYITEALAAECKNVIEKYQERITGDYSNPRRVRKYRRRCAGREKFSRTGSRL